MSQIDQFNDFSGASIDDFVEESATPPITSSGSNKNLAAHAAMLSPDPAQAGQAYQQAQAELDMNGDSQTADALLSNARGQNMHDYRQSAVSVLMDSSMTDQWKRAALDTVNDPNSPLYEARNMVATHAATKTVKGESHESSFIRADLGASVVAANEYQRKVQQLYNEQQLLSERSSIPQYVGMAEDMAPMVHGYKEARINEQLMGDKGSTWRKMWDTVWVGNTIADRRDTFNAMPLDARMRALDGLAEAIQSNGSTILLPDEKDQYNLKVLQETIDANAYNVTTQTVDNILGLMDVVGMGAMLRGIKRLASGASEVADAAEGGARAATQGNPRKPTPGTDWRTGQQGSPVTVDSNGNPSYAVREPMSTDATVRSWARRFAISDVQPTSLSQTVKDVNPEQARALHTLATKDETGDAAAAIYGTSREDAIAHDISPQPAGVKGEKVSKVYHPERDGDFEFMPDADVLDFVEHSGASWLTPSEKRVLRSSAINDFQNATGLFQRKEMGSVSEIDGGVRFDAVYGPSDSGWASVEDAIYQAQYALRNYGITKDDISVLARSGTEYVPMSLDDAVKAAPGDFLLNIKHDYKFNTANLERDGFESLDVKNNFIDRWLPSSGSKAQGTLQSHVLDPQSMLHPNLTKGATVGVGRMAGLSKKLNDIVVDYAKDVKGLSGKSQQKLFAKIREANYKGEAFNYANLKAEGFTAAEVGALSKWKKAQDTLYSLTNRDLVNTYRTRGFGLLEMPERGTRLLVKPVKHGQASGITRAYDPVADAIVDVDKMKVDALYGGNGQIAKVHTPFEVDGETVLHVVDRNTVNSSYIRTLRDNDTVLNYRKGYYAVRYKDPHFIEKRVEDVNGKAILDESGKEVWKAVATAGNVADAERAITRLTTTRGGTFRRRSDLRGEAFEEASHAVLQTGGMSAQRIRGQRLEEALGNNLIDPDAIHIQSPLESLIQSAQSLSNRVSMRDWLETSKQRFLAQYAEVLPQVKGQTVYPATRGEIGERGLQTSKMAADARTTWEYIRQMENGFHNTIDDGWKALFNGLGEALGTKGFGKAEELARGIGGSAITSKAKGVAFSLLLATNPLRQFLIQSHQVLMLGSVFPKYTVTHMADDLLLMLTYAAGGTPTKALLKVSGRTEREASAMWDALKKSNIGASITQHNMVRESLNSIADEASKARIATTTFAKATAPLASVVTASRKIGFDFGEYISSSASFLAHYDQAIQQGRKMNLETIEDIYAKSRNFTYNMDRAGDMPYNHNSVNIITQFLQVPHKAVTQFLTNRQLSVEERGKIFSYLAIMFGTTSLGVGRSDIFETYVNELLPEDSVTRRLVLNGIESVFLNKAFSEMYGTKVDLDYSSIAPLDAYGLSDFITNIMSNDIGEILSASPSGSLVFGTNPRISRLVNSVSTMIGLKENFEDNPIKWSNVAMDAANLSSGLSNAFKAAYAWEYGKKIGALGGTTDESVSKPEAIAAALGLPTHDESQMRKAMDAIYKNDADVKKDVDKIFQITANQFKQEGMTPDQLEWTFAMSGRMMSVFKGNPKAKEYWAQNMRKQQANKDWTMMKRIMEFSQWGDSNQVKNLINTVPNLTPEQRQGLHAIVDYNLQYRPDLKQKESK